MSCSARGWRKCARSKNSHKRNGIHNAHQFRNNKCRSVIQLIIHFFLTFTSARISQKWKFGIFEFQFPGKASVRVEGIKWKTQFPIPINNVRIAHGWQRSVAANIWRWHQSISPIGTDVIAVKISWCQNSYWKWDCDCCGTAESEERNSIGIISTVEVHRLQEKNINYVGTAKETPCNQTGDIVWQRRGQCNKDKERQRQLRAIAAEKKKVSAHRADHYCRTEYNIRSNSLRLQNIQSENSNEKGDANQSQSKTTENPKNSNNFFWRRERNRFSTDEYSDQAKESDSKDYKNSIETRKSRCADTWRSWWCACLQNGFIFIEISESEADHIGGLRCWTKTFRSNR